MKEEAWLSLSGPAVIMMMMTVQIELLSLIIWTVSYVRSCK